MVFAWGHHTNRAMVAKKIIQHGHTYSICCRPEVAGDIVLGFDVKAVEGYVMVNFEVVSCNNPQAIRIRKPTNWWGGVKRDITHPTANVVYYHLF